MTLAATGVIASCSTGSMACADARFVVLAEEACDLCPTTRAVEQHRRGGVREKRGHVARRMHGDQHRCGSTNERFSSKVSS